jgi:D-glycero-alpha-D-manno-heptose 1-phosphate guanylyltransferase
MLEEVAVILAGGLGTRLRSVVSDRPKPMAEVGGKPFLEYLVERLLSYNVSSIVICVSYMRESIISYFGEKYRKRVLFSIEETPLGTGGALARARELLPLSSSVLVFNGDTFLPIDYLKLENFHALKKADFTIVLARSTNPQFGGVTIDSNSKVIDFGLIENRSGLVNAGLYLIERSVFDLLPDQHFSLEKDFLPGFVRQGGTYGYVSDRMFVDIGTPQSYLSLIQNGDILKK